MSYEDRVRLVILVDSALALSSVEIGVEPSLSTEAYTANESTPMGDWPAFQVHYNDLALFEAQADPVIQDPNLRRLLEQALMAIPHAEFVEQLTQPGETELDIQLARRGLAGTGLDLKEGGQRKALIEYRESST